MNSYEQRKEARIERLRERAEKKRAEGQQRLAQAQRTADMIPLGQPILVGHHSEKRHRRDLQRIHNGYDKGYQALNEAEALERRAANAEDNRQISSDDPSALDKLKAKVAALEQERATMKEINVLLRKSKGNVDKAQELFKAAGFDPAAAVALLKPDFAGRTGFPAYKFTNMGAEIRRLQGRIVELEREAARAAELAPEQAERTFGNITLRETDDRVQLVFPGKPAEDVRQQLKRAGFRWSPTNQAWQRQNNFMGRRAAEELARRLGEAV